MNRRAFLALLPAVAANVLVATGVTAKTPENRLQAGNGFFPLTETPTSDNSVRFIAFGDAGIGDNAQNYLANVMR